MLLTLNSVQKARSLHAVGRVNVAHVPLSRVLTMANSAPKAAARSRTLKRPNVEPYFLTAEQPLPLSRSSTAMGQPWHRGLTDRSRGRNRNRMDTEWVLGRRTLHSILRRTMPIAIPTPTPKGRGNNARDTQVGNSPVAMQWVTPHPGCNSELRSLPIPAGRSLTER